MRVTIYSSVGYAGTSVQEDFEVPEDVVAGGKRAIEDFVASLLTEEYDRIREQLAVWYELAEDEEEE